MHFIQQWKELLYLRAQRHFWNASLPPKDPLCHCLHKTCGGGWIQRCHLFYFRNFHINNKIFMMWIPLYGKTVLIMKWVPVFSVYIFHLLLQPLHSHLWSSQNDTWGVHVLKLLTLDLSFPSAANRPHSALCHELMCFQRTILMSFGGSRCLN